MNPNRELAAFVVAAQDVADLRTKSGALGTKLLAVAIDPLLLNCDIHAARRLARDHREALLFAIKRTSLPKLQTLSKKWNPHREPKAKEAFQTDLIDELSRLALGTMQPALKQPKKKAARRHSAVQIAAE